MPSSFLPGEGTRNRQRNPMSSKILRRDSLFWTYRPVDRMAATLCPSFMFHADSLCFGKETITKIKVKSLQGGQNHDSGT